MKKPDNDNYPTFNIEDVPDADLAAMAEAGYLPMDRYVAEAQRRKDKDKPVAPAADDPGPAGRG